jgi:hypothetical protein
MAKIFRISIKFYWMPLYSGHNLAFNRKIAILDCKLKNII